MLLVSQLRRIACFSASYACGFNCAILFGLRRAVSALDLHLCMFSSRRHGLPDRRSHSHAVPLRLPHASPVTRPPSGQSSKTARRRFLEIHSSAARPPSKKGPDRSTAVSFCSILPCVFSPFHSYRDSEDECGPFCGPDAL